MVGPYPERRPRRRQHPARRHRRPELFGSRWSGVAAAVLLTLTPGHFFFARLAQDYFLSQTYALLWLVLLLAFLDSGRRWLLVLAGLTLGVGIYTHISSWIVMPFYFVVTTAVLILTRKPFRAYTALAAGSAIAMVPLAVFLWGYPALLSDMFLNYKPVTSPNLAERVTLYWDYFNPSFLFFSGGADPMWATRRVGVFLLAIAILLPIGIYSVMRRGWSTQLLLLVGFLFAPVPIVIALPEAPHTPPRAICSSFRSACCSASPACSGSWPQETAAGLPLPRCS